MLGNKLGNNEGLLLTTVEGLLLGYFDGDAVTCVKTAVGIVEGSVLGRFEGKLLGASEDDSVGMLLGSLEGQALSCKDGAIEGSVEG